MDDETAFAALKAGLDLVGPGEKVFLNTCEWFLADCMVIHSAYAVGSTCSQLNSTA